MADLWLIHQLAAADYLHDRRLSFPLVISLAAVLAPLLVLFGLKFGIVSSMEISLSQDPTSRELRPIGQGQYDTAWFDLLRQRSDVAFVLPSTRFLAATMSLRNPDSKTAGPVQVELRPSAIGDPLLEGIDSRPEGYSTIVLSTPAAEALDVKIGMRLDGRIRRTLRSGKKETLKLPVRVTAVLPPSRSQRLEALVSLPFLLAAEDFREGFAVSELGVSGRKRPEGERYFASFRLYTTSIDEVAGLREWLAQESGVRSDARLAEIELIQKLDRSLAILFLLIATLGGGGYLVSLSVSLWANTQRKRRDLSLLRLAGLRSFYLAIFPIAQASFTAVLGVLLAIGLYLPIESLINRLFSDSLVDQQVLAKLEARHFFFASVASCGFAVLTAVASGVQAARITPSEGLREE